MSLASLRELLGKIDENISASTVVIEAGMRSSGSMIYALILSVTLIVIILGILLAIFNSRSITRPIKVFMERFFKGASGDLTALYPWSL